MNSSELKQKTIITNNNGQKEYLTNLNIVKFKKDISSKVFKIQEDKYFKEESTFIGNAKTLRQYIRLIKNNL